MPRATSSVSLSQRIWANELTTEVGTLMVQDVRANISANIRGCPVCYMIGGEEGTTHTAGKKCPKMPLIDATTPGWKSFKDDLNFVEGIYCWKCLLPTVRISLFRFNHCD